MYDSLATRPEAAKSDWVFIMSEPPTHPTMNPVLLSIHQDGAKQATMISLSLTCFKVCGIDDDPSHPSGHSTGADCGVEI